MISVRLLYNIGIYLYFFAASVAGLFNRKAFLLVSGRKGLIKSLRQKMAAAKGRDVLWFHCSSVGEFEQARPLIERFRKEEPDKFILITFFSPSGYELRKNFGSADVVSYLPMDTVRNVRRFLDVVRPSTAIFVKYEFWYNYLNGLRKRAVPTYIVSAIFRRDQIFFRWYGSFMRKALKCYTMLFVQNEESRRLLSRMGIENAVIAGDTRFDRVMSICRANNMRNEVIETFVGDGKTWVAGSTWEDDERLIAKAFKEVSGSRLILVPHEVEPARISAVRRIFRGFRTILYSECQGRDVGEYRERACAADILIIDCVGILPTIYKYGMFAYVGGGFSSSGIHNILEAAIYGSPVIFGPCYHKFQEAVDLVAIGGAFSVSSSVELIRLLQRWLNVPGSVERPSQVCSQYVESHLGASDRIVECILGRT